MPLGLLRVDFRPQNANLSGFFSGLGKLRKFRQDEVYRRFVKHRAGDFFGEPVHVQ